MKLRILVVLPFFLTLTYSGFSQFAFGVAPGLHLNGAYFGYQIGDIVVPYIGMQYIAGKVTIEETGFADSELRGAIIAPVIGAKIFAIRKNRLKAYFGVSLSKPFITAKYEEEGVEDPDVEDFIDSVNLLGFEGGFGVEYFFDGNFSLGGEFGYRNLALNYKEDGGDYQVKARLSPTFTKLTVNYYFGDSELSEKEE